MRKYIAMIAAALLLLCTLTACSEETPTPAEIFGMIESSENMRVELVINFDNIQCSTTIIEEDGERSHVSMETESFGAKSGDEYYVDTVDGVRWIYTENADGTWGKESLHQLLNTATSSGFADFFSDALYYKEDGNYRMYKTASVEFEDMTFNDVEIMILEDGSYCLTAVVSKTVDSLPVYGGATITFRQGGAAITIPEV